MSEVLKKEKVENVVTTGTSAKFNLDEYVKMAKIKSGTVAGFKLQGNLEPKTKKDWAEAFKTYNERII